MSSDAKSDSPFEFVTRWPQGTPKHGYAALEFWRREKTIDDGAQQHLHEIVLYTMTSSGEVAAACTDVAIYTLPQLKHYRE